MDDHRNSAVYGLLLVVIFSIVGFWKGRNLDNVAIRHQGDDGLVIGKL